MNSDHSLQKAPLAIIEVKRILLEHLNSPANAAVSANPPVSPVPVPAQARLSQLSCSQPAPTTRC